MKTNKILVIRLSALGDFVLSIRYMKAIKQHHPKAHIVLLTTPPYEALAKSTAYFDEVWIDKKPKFWHIRACWRLRQRIRQARFEVIYDLQTSSRSGFYYHLIRPNVPKWSGIVKHCTFEDKNPDRCALHTIERQKEQLIQAGITKFPVETYDWVPLTQHRLSEPFVLLVPGGAVHRVEKRWPLSHYLSVAHYLSQVGIMPVFIGGKGEYMLPDATPGINLLGKTTILDLFALGRQAQGAIGNDTGPMHVFGAVGCPSLVLFSHASDPQKCAPRGMNKNSVRILQVEDLHCLLVEDVVKSIDFLNKPS